ncbi:MAG: PEP/pyruvate-binding domain-containing protein, partial [Vicinamibacterales bacterium]
GCAAMSVLVQEMVRADAAGVAFSADPVTGDRDVVVVSAVRGVGERLVSGTASAEEWRVKGTQPTRLRNDDVLNVETVLGVAELARRLESLAGAPQDIEWAVEQGQLRLLQARPLTAVPAAVSWSVPWGGWVRNFRLGEWIGDPVTPSFESWLLRGIEEGMHGHVERLTGWRMARPFHLVVNGWYYYGLNLFEPGTSRWRVAVRIPTMVGRVSRNLRAFAGLNPPTAHLGFDWGVREWRQQLLPATEELVRQATGEVSSAQPADLAMWIDRLAANAGRNFASVIAVSGYSAKAEFALARFWAKHLKDVDGSWLELVRTGDAAASANHDVQGLDWFHPTLGELTHSAAKPDGSVRQRIAQERDALTRRVTETLADRPRLQKQFLSLLKEAQRAHVVREEQSRSMTLAWPVLRQAILRIGDELVTRGSLATREQVFFLKRDDIHDALIGTTTPALATQAAARRKEWNRQRGLQAPLILGELPGLFKAAFAQMEQALFEGRAPESDEIRGMPGSPGRATGPVKVIRSVADVARLKPGDILVTSVTTPAWTPAFSIVAAVVTDTGSVASHASVVAREYGVPAVVGTGNATTRLRDGDVVTVDGAKATVRVLQVVGS